MQRVVHPSAETPERLAKLGLSEAPFLEAMQQANLKRAWLTNDHPIVYPGFMMWAELVKALREQLSVYGWETRRKGNYELVVSDELRLAIAVASGDEATGVPTATPTNRSPKGQHTFDIIEANRQLDLFAEPSGIEEPEYETWVLLHYTAHLELRMELSRPAAIGRDGKIKEWSERVIMSSIPLVDDSIEIVGPSGPDLDVDIRRRSAS